MLYIIHFQHQWQMNSVHNQQMRGKELLLHLQISLTHLCGSQKTQSDLCLHHLLFRASTSIYRYIPIKYLFHSLT